MAAGRRAGEALGDNVAGFYEYHKARPASSGKVMVLKDKVCKSCKLFVKESVCPICRQSNFSRSWKGVIVVKDPSDSDVAKLLSITIPGKYCLWVK